MNHQWKGILFTTIHIFGSNAISSHLAIWIGIFYINSRLPLIPKENSGYVSALNSCYHNRLDISLNESI